MRNSRERSDARLSCMMSTEESVDIDVETDPQVTVNIYGSPVASVSTRRPNDIRASEGSTGTNVVDPSAINRVVSFSSSKFLLHTCVSEE